MKKRILSLLSVLLMLCVFITPAYAKEVPDLSKTGSISVTMTYKGKAVPGGTLTLIRVAEVYHEDGNYSFRYLDTFADCGVSLEDLTTEKTAKALAYYAAKNKITGTTQSINKEGYVLFEDLELGLYLLVQNKAAKGYSAVTPFLVSVPGRDGEKYIYNVNGSPKMDVEPAPTETTDSTTPTKPSKLPQTGQTQWPVPLLASAGLFLFAIGWYLHASARKKSHES